MPNPAYFQAALMPSAGEHSKRRFQCGQQWADRLPPIFVQLFYGGNAMKLPRRQFLHLAAGAAALPVVSRIASAQAYPSRPVRLIVGAPAGVGFDITSRLMSQLLSERLF